MNNIVNSENRPIACVILPTYNEVANISIIVPKIFAQQARISSHLLHILVVDDNSPDGTQDVVKNLMQTYPNLHLITGPKQGLGEAYKRGMAWSTKELDPDLIFEMDADLQHDPDFIPMFVSLAEYGFSLVIGSRFTPGGSTPNFSLCRKLVSRAGNWLIRYLGGIPRITDCTSGYRCIKVDLIRQCDLSFLSTRGYSFQSSLLCELIRNEARVVEVPIIFADRQNGDSKLALRDQIEFVLNIPRIRFNQSRVFAKFCIVGASGVLVNMGCYAAFTRMLGLPLEIASPIAIEFSILTNFALNHIWTFRWRETHGSWHDKIVKFHMVASLAAIINYVILLWLVNLLGMWDIAANFIGITLGTLVNYSMNSFWTWKAQKDTNLDKQPFRA